MCPEYYSYDNSKIYVYILFVWKRENITMYKWRLKVSIVPNMVMKSILKLFWGGKEIYRKIEPIYFLLFILHYIICRWHKIKVYLCFVEIRQKKSSNVAQQLEHLSFLRPCTFVASIISNSKTGNFTLLSWIPPAPARKTPFTN